MDSQLTVPSTDPNIGTKLDSIDKILTYCGSDNTKRDSVSSGSSYSPPPSCHSPRSSVSTFSRQSSSESRVQDKNSEKSTGAIIKPFAKFAYLTPNNCLRLSISIVVLKECIAELNVLVNVNASIAGNPKPEGLLKEIIHDKSKEINLTRWFDESSPELRNLRKFQLDVNNIANALNDLIIAIKQDPGSGPLNVLIKAIKMKQMMEKRILDKTRNDERLYGELKSKLDKERKMFLKKNAELDEAIRDLKMHQQDLREHLEAEMSYIRRWQDAREEQNKMKHGGKEEIFKNTISHSALKSDYENQIHGTIGMYLEEDIKDQWKEIEAWSDKYDNDMDLKTNEILQKNVALEKITDQCNELGEKFAKRAKEMEAWLAYKKAAKLKAILRRVQHRAAFKIQIWWREVMIRKKLYGKNEKKKGKGKGKKN